MRGGHARPWIGVILIASPSCLVPGRIKCASPPPDRLNESQTSRRPAQPSLARRQRSTVIRTSLTVASIRLRFRRLGRPARHRHHQHLERNQRLSRPPACARRKRQARCAASRRLSDRIAGDVAGGAVRQAFDHALPQLPGDGGGGTAAQPPARRRRAARRLRQDHAGPGDGRHQHGHSGDLRSGGSDAARQLARRVSRFGLRRVEILDGEARRQHHRGAVERDGGRHRALLRNLHGDGHGGDHDGDRRGARPDAAGRVVHPGGRFRPSAHVRRRRAPHRRHGVGRSDPRSDPDAGRLRQRHQGPHGDGRFDQCHHPRDCNGAPCRDCARHAAVRPAFARDPGARQRAAIG